jgi:Nuclease-related domain.
LVNTGKENKLQPKIIGYLEKNGNTRLDLLVNNLNQITGVPKDKIEFRINKMVSKGDLFMRNGVLSKPTQPVAETFDEMEVFGPLTIARRENSISLSREYRPKFLEKVRKELKADALSYESKISEDLAQIEAAILKQYDPLDVIAYVATKNMLVDPETWTESSFTGNQIIPESFQNIALKNDYENYARATREGMDQFDESSNQFRTDLSNYLLTVTLTKENLSPVEAEVYFHTISHFLLVRGDAYPQHYEEISSELFSKINDVLKTKGFTIEEYWETVKEIDRQIKFNFNEPTKQIVEEQARFFEFAKKEFENGTKTEDIRVKYRKEAADRIQSLQPLLKKFFDIALKGCYEIELNDHINKQLLELLSMTFGQNKGWNNPLDKSDVAIRPIVKVADKYYCFLLPHLVRNAIGIVEGQLNSAEKIKYSDVKGDYFEQKAVCLLNRMILGDAYLSLKYPKDNEIDGIIVRKDRVFLIEVKGKKKRIVAGVEDVLTLTKDDIKAHIFEAFDQTNKAYAFIQSREEAEFKDKFGKVVVRIKKTNFSKFHKIVVNLEDFSRLSIDMNLVKTWVPDIVRSPDYAWVVSIYNLIIISEILEKDPESFIRYLEERLRVAENSTIEAVDEIDYLGYFLENGSLRKQKNMVGADIVQIIGYSEKIDRWYSYLRGEIKNAEKPVIKKLS